MPWRSTDESFLGTDFEFQVSNPSCKVTDKTLSSGTASAGPPVQSLGTQQATFGQFGTNNTGFNSSNTFGANNSSMFGAGNTSFAANNSVSIGTKRNKH